MISHHFLDVIDEDALQVLVVVEVLALCQGCFVLLHEGKQAGREIAVGINDVTKRVRTSEW